MRAAEPFGDTPTEVRMTRRNRRALLFSVPAATLALGVAVFLLVPRTAITRENFAGIEPGRSDHAFVY
jgi:hypothetical protein